MVNHRQKKVVFSSAVALVASAAALLMIAGCGAAGSSSATTANALVLDPDAILGFETPTAWSASHGSAAWTTMRTQGAAAYALTTAEDEITLHSAAVASTANALAGVGDEGASFAIDVMLPSQIKHSEHAGSLELSLSAPSRGIKEADLGRVRFKEMRSGIFTTVKFAVPEHVRKALAGATYADLTFEIELRGPEDDDDAHKDEPRTYRFDNLRVHSPAAAPPGVGQSVDLVARLDYAPPQSTPGVANFPVGIVQVPQNFHLKLGKAGSGSAQLDLGYGGTAVISCTYGAVANGTGYDLTSCTGGAKAGDLYGADYARLTILGGDASAGTTAIRAQLALNPVGDLAGAGIIPPMPTFWGQTPTESNNIVSAYTDAVRAEVPERSGLRIKAPVPDFARRFGNGAPQPKNVSAIRPFDNQVQVFDQGGHLNPGGDWDAYWELSGNLTTDDSNNDATSHFEADLSAHAVVWGQDVDVIEIKASVDTDNGQVDSTGIHHPSASGSVSATLLGIDLPGGGSVNPQTGFNFDFDQPEHIEVARAQFYVFALTFDVLADAGVKASGSLSPNGFGIGVLPHASFGARVFGGVDVGIASGGVDANVALLDISTPVNASLSWSVSTDPGVCSAAATFSYDGSVQIGSGGGHVDATATFGPCPFCVETSYTIFDWPNLPITGYQLFSQQNQLASFPLDQSLCIVPLNVGIDVPTPGTHFVSGAPAPFHGFASRPSATSGNFGVDCSFFTWSIVPQDPSDVFINGNKGCSPTIKFGTPGARTVILNVEDKFHEKGQASVDITVTPPTLVASISQPDPHQTPTIVNEHLVALSGSAVNGTPGYDYAWWMIDPNGNKTFVFGGHSVDGNNMNATADVGQVVGTFTFELDVTDSTQLTAPPALAKAIIAHVQ